jgi:hypothetical protein
MFERHLAAWSRCRIQTCGPAFQDSGHSRTSDGDSEGKLAFRRANGEGGRTALSTEEGFGTFEVEVCWDRVVRPPSLRGSEGSSKPLFCGVKSGIQKRGGLSDCVVYVAGCSQKISDEDKREGVKGFLRWMLGPGQRQAAALGYLALPKDLIVREEAAIHEVR